MDVQDSAPTNNIRSIAGEDRLRLSIDVPPDRKFAMSATRHPCRRRPGRAKGRALSRAATWAAQAAALLALATLLTGCHSTRVVWAKSGGDPAALQDDMQACNYQPTTATPPGYQAGAAPGYQPSSESTAFSTSPMTSTYSTPAHPTSAYPTSAASGSTAKLVTIDVQDTQRVAVNCMIAHGWRLTPLP